MNAQITMTGNVGAEPESRVTRNGVLMTSFRLACTPRIKRDGAWVDDATMWVKVCTYRGLAENVLESLHKGDPVLVTGKLRLEPWVGSDGQPRETKVLDATSVGHDQSWGTSVFTRVRRCAVQAPDPEPDDPDFDAEPETEPAIEMQRVAAPVG